MKDGKCAQEEGGRERKEGEKERERKKDSEKKKRVKDTIEIDMKQK